MEEQVSIEEDHLLMMIDEAIKEAAQVMELHDLDQYDEELLESAYEERFHCGTCIVRTVLEQVWPSVENYVKYLKEEK